MKKFKETENASLSSFARLPAGLMGRYEFLMNRPAQRIREMTEKTLRPLAIHAKQYGMLATIHYEGPSTQRAIGEMLKIDRTTMVLLVDDLEEKKLVIRDDHPKDRRYYLLHLTSSGKRLFQKAQQLILKAEKEFLAPLSGKERQELRQVLSKLFHDIPMQRQ